MHEWQVKIGADMAKVLGFGGVFVKVADTKAYTQWYSRALGVDITDWNTMMWHSDGQGFTMLSPFSADTEYFKPSTHRFMINLRVDDTRALMERAKREGAEIVGEIEDNEFGIFGWFIDPEGLKVELWQAPEASDSNGAAT